MRFSTAHSVQNELNLIVLKDGQTGTEISVLPEFGASLHAFKIALNKVFFNVIDNYEDLAEAKRILNISYKSSKLSPFPCRIPDGKYRIQDNEFVFTNKFPDGSAIHGLLFNKHFETVDEFADDKMASAVFKYDYRKEDAGYPFDYRCEIRYLLLPDNVLKLETTVTNTGITEIPIADGWHPYFQLGDAIDNCTLQFNSGDLVEFDEKLIPTGRLLSYNLFNTPKPLKDIQLDNCFIPAHKSGDKICEIFNPSNRLRISFFTDNSYPYLQIYTPPHRKSIAIENLSGAPNCFNNGMGLTKLFPRHSQTFSVHYQVRVG